MPALANLRHFAICAATLLSVVPLTSEPLTAEPLFAQDQRVKTPADPYTRGEPARMSKAGYVSFGPFPFATNQLTSDIQELLGTEPLKWIETEHFRIGCSLSAVACKGREPWRKEWRTLLHQELRELRTKLPSVPLRPTVLDPWLRAHLVAHRLEKLYASVSAIVGVDDEWFPAGRGDAFAPKEYRGEGPYFGMPQKFTVLLVKSGASHARYMRATENLDMPEPIRSFDAGLGCAYWGASEEAARGLFRNDFALHANLVFNVAHNLYTCFRGLGHQLPPWVATGLGHWHARKVTPRFPAYDRVDDRDRTTRSPLWAWDQRIEGLVANRAFEEFESFIDRLESGAFRVEQHMQSWAMIDYLLRCKRPQLRKFLHLLKEPMHNRRRLPTATERQRRQREALILAFDCDVEDLELGWRTDVLTNKPRYRK